MQQRCHHASTSARSPSWPPIPRPRLQRAATARREKVQLRIREQIFFFAHLRRRLRVIFFPSGSCCWERTGIFVRRTLHVEGCCSASVFLCVLCVLFSVSQGWIYFFSLPDGLRHLFGDHNQQRLLNQVPINNIIFPPQSLYSYVV